MSTPRVLMIGPGRDVMGGIATVVNSYYILGLDNNVDLYYLPTMGDGCKFKKLLLAFKAYAVFSSIIKQYDIIHIHMAAQASFDRKAFFVKKAYRSGKKIIIHQHSADFDKYYFEQVDDIKRREIRDIFSLADKVLVLSKEWAEFFSANVCDPEKIIILHNGVVMTESKKSNYSDHNVLMLGRLGKRKGTYDLLEAIPRVVDKVDDAVFYLCGDGDVAQCMKIVADNGLENHVKFPGWVRDRDKEEFYRKCSIFILPSYYEGMPMAVLEAMNYGLATISTNAGGIPQIIEQGISGIRIDAGNVDAIVDTLVYLLNYDTVRETMGRAGRQRIERDFDFRLNVDRLIKIYREMI